MRPTQEHKGHGGLLGPTARPHMGISAARRSRSVAMSLAAEVVILVACGSTPSNPSVNRFSGEQRRAAEAVVAFVRAVQERDGEAVCRLVLFPPGGSSDDRKSCEEKVFSEADIRSTLDPDKLKITNVTVHGDRATVRVAGSASPANLSKVDGNWKVVFVDD